MEILGSQFNLLFLKKGDRDTGGGGSLVHWQGPLEAPGSLTGVQQRLQLLGYYTGCVDGQMGRKSERAILEFQADEGGLAIDGVAGPKTQQALDAFFQKHGYDSTGKHYLIRRYLARFERARIGDTHASCPHPDYRGGDNTVVSFGYKVSSWADRDRDQGVTGSAFYVGLDFEGGLDFSNDTVLAPKFKKNPNFGIVTLEQTNAKHQADHNYNRPYVRIQPMVKDGEDTLDIHYGSEKGPVVASLEVKTPGMKQVLVAVHLLTITDARGLSVVPWTRREALGLIEMVNAIWMPMGIEFQVREVQEERFTGATSGEITDDYSVITGRIESNELWSAFNIKGERRINIYFCESILWLLKNGLSSNSILGFAISRSRQGPLQPIGVCVRKDADFFNLALTVAHELGHVLELTCHQHAHSDDDGSDLPFRHDIWSRSRLMAKFSQYPLDIPPRRWQSSTYGTSSQGYLQCGAWLTAKRLKMDGTDDELKISRSASAKPY
ncbi:MAG: peptidoglycan-binding domain-containing protein [Fibrobacteria bacterium]